MNAFLAARLGDFLDEIGSETPAPGGGSVAAVVAAMAAGLVGMAARFSQEHWEEARGVVAQAETLRARVTPLAEADAHAFEEVLAALRLPAQLEPEVRNAAIANALGRAADIPLAIARDAADVALLAALVAENGNANLRADAVAGALLAEAAAKAAAHLVAINLGTTREDERIVQARDCVAVASDGSARALAAGG